MGWDSVKEVLSDGLIDVGKYMVKDSFEQRSYAKRQAVLEQMQIASEERSADRRLTEAKRDRDWRLEDRADDRTYNEKLKGEEREFTEKQAKTKHEYDLELKRLEKGSYGKLNDVQTQYIKGLDIEIESVDDQIESARDGGALPEEVEALVEKRNGLLEGRTNFLNRTVTGGSSERKKTPKEAGAETKGMLDTLPDVTSGGVVKDMAKDIVKTKPQGAVAPNKGTPEHLAGKNLAKALSTFENIRKRQSSGSNPDNGPRGKRIAAANKAKLNLELKAIDRSKLSPKEKAQYDKLVKEFNS